MIRRPPRSTLFPYTNALPICLDGVVLEAVEPRSLRHRRTSTRPAPPRRRALDGDMPEEPGWHAPCVDRKSTRLNSSHANISYAVFCLKKKKNYTSLLRPLSTS